MQSVRPEGFNHVFGKPVNWNDEIGTCYDLEARVGTYQGSDLLECTSAWKPDAADLVILNQGGVIELVIVGNQPPVRLDVVSQWMAINEVGDTDERDMTHG